MPSIVARPARQPVDVVAVAAVVRRELERRWRVLLEVAREASRDRNRLQRLVRVVWAVAVVFGVGFVYRRRKQIVGAVRRFLNTFQRTAGNVNDLMFSSSSLASGLAKDLRDYIYGDSGRAPQSLRRLIVLMSSTEVQQTLHGTVHAILAAFFAARRREAGKLAAQGAQGESMDKMILPVVDKVADRVLSEEGRQYSVEMLRALAREFLLVYLANKAPAGGKCGAGAGGASERGQGAHLSATESEAATARSAATTGSDDGEEIGGLAGPARWMHPNAQEVSDDDSVVARDSGAEGRVVATYVNVVMDKLCTDEGRALASESVSAFTGALVSQGLPIALDYQQQGREASSGLATVEAAGAAVKPNALETVLLWACDPDSAPGARLLCKEVAGEAVRSAVSTACAHWKAGQEGEAMAAAGRADSWGREEGTRGGESWRYEEGENPDLLLAENPTRDGPNGHGLMRPSSGQRFAAAVGHDSSAAARHEGGGGWEARGGDARIERVWPVVVRVAASAECRRLVCEVAGVCVREALRTGWSCLVGCGEEEGSDGARDSKGEDLNGGVVQRGAAGREKRVRGGGRMLQGLTAGARMVQWTVACSRGGLRRLCGWGWVVGVGACTGWGTWLVVSEGWGGEWGTEASAVTVAASVCVAVLVAHVLTLCVTWLLSARVTASIAPPPVTSPPPARLGGWAHSRVTNRTHGGGRGEAVLAGADAVGEQLGSDKATLAAEWAACGYHCPLSGSEALGGGRVGVE